MFQNAHAGIKKIFASEIMMLIASIIICVGAVVTLASISETDENPTSIMILGAIVIAFAIITLIAFILNIVGLSKAKKRRTRLSNGVHADHRRHSCFPCVRLFQQ